MPDTCKCFKKFLFCFDADSLLNDTVRNEEDADVLSRNNMPTPQLLVGILDEMATFPENPFLTI